MTPSETADASVHFNKLTPAQAERLALLAEECGELVQAIGKVLRHGYASFNPLKPDGQQNIEAVEKECGDVLLAIELLVDAGDIDTENIQIQRENKRESVKRYLHHASVKP